MCMQRLAFFLPLLLSTPLSMLLIYVKSISCSSAVPFEHGDLSDHYLIPLAICLWLAQVMSTGVYLWKEQTFIMAKESSLFWLPVYNGKCTIAIILLFILLFIHLLFHHLFVCLIIH